MKLVSSGKRQKTGGHIRGKNAPAARFCPLWVERTNPFQRTGVTFDKNPHWLVFHSWPQHAVGTLSVAASQKLELHKFYGWHFPLDGSAYDVKLDLSTSPGFISVCWVGGSGVALCTWWWGIYRQGSYQGTGIYRQGSYQGKESWLEKYIQPCKCWVLVWETINFTASMRKQNCAQWPPRLVPGWQNPKIINLLNPSRNFSTNLNAFPLSVPL